MNNKYYILATPCSGKTTFIESNSFNDIILYDMDDFKKPKDWTIFDRIQCENDNIHIIIGEPHTPNFNMCEYFSVIIDKNQLKINIKQRNLNQPEKRIKKMKQILPFRNRLEEITGKYNIEVYNNFIDVIEIIKNKHNKN